MNGIHKWDNHFLTQIFFPELKTKEGYSGHCADIYPWRYMSAQHIPREIYILREMLCEHSADIYLQ